MKIAFINPAAPFVFSNEPLKEFIESSPFMYFYNQFWSGFSTGLLTLAALTPDKFDMEYLDGNYQEIPYENDYDIVAITATTSQADRAYAIADRYRKKEKPPLVVIGGSHASFLPDEAQQHVDVVFIGEGERSWPKFLDDFCVGKQAERYNAADYPLVDLNEIPVPRYDLLDPDFYNMIWIQTSRGCPINCEFCSATKFSGRKHRIKTVSQVINEIVTARNHLKMKQILFSDDNMLWRRERNYELLDEIKKLQISFVAQSDITIGKNPDFLDYLKECGCSTVFIGFESLDERNLSLMNNTNYKQKTLDKYSEYIRNITEAGIGVYGAFIIGYDNDTNETFRDLAEFITGNFLSGAQITILTPLPGTDLRERYRNNKRILDTPWSNYTFFDVNIDHPNLSMEEIKDGMIWVYRRVYNKEYLDRKNAYYKQVFINRLSRTS